MPSPAPASSTHSTSRSATPMPAAFIGHGTPMNALEDNRYTRAWREFGDSVPRPRAILMVSAHWYTRGTAVTAMPAPSTIHDFYGFPDELFAVRYDAPGLPDLADQVAEIAKPRHVGADHGGWGLDHGAWSVLVHAFPDATIPVVQLSVDASMAHDEHLALGAALAPLREQGVLIIGSGNIVHNLSAMNPRAGDAGYDWARRFDDAARAHLLEQPTEVAELAGHPDFAAAAPTPDHYLPMLYVAGLAGTEPLQPLVDGYEFGSLSMSSYTLGMQKAAV